MLKKLPLFGAFLLIGMLLPTQKSHAQISYTQDFEGEVYVYSVDGYDLDFDGYGCEVSSLFTNIYWYEDYDKELISMPIGVSNGEASVFTYDYKILAYEDLSAYANSPEWGSFTWSYATSPAGPWTEIETVDPTNHIESADCATRTVSLPSTPIGNFYLKITATVNADNFTDALIFFDNITFNQDPSPECSGAPVASSVIGGSDCTYSDVVLGLDEFYTENGVSIQWQFSTDGTSFTDIPDADGPEYATTVTAEAVWYRAIITCANSGLSTTSEALQLLGTGLCYCTPSFTYAVEPITNVVFAGVDNTTDATVDGSEALEDFTTTLPAAEVILGQSYDIYVQGNTDGDFDDYVTVYFDFNANGSFEDEGESFDIELPISNSTGEDGQMVSTSITIPTTATLGTTRFRVFKRYAANPESSCGSYGFGQVEDYAVTITEDTNSAEGFTKNNFKYSPNPVVNELNLQYTATIEAIQVTNMLGQVVLTANNVGATNTKVDMSNLQTGTYIVKVTNANGNNIAVKVVKQ